jgi:hypothetical protein
MMPLLRMPVVGSCRRLAADDEESLDMAAADDDDGKPGVAVEEELSSGTFDLRRGEDDGRAADE